MFRAIASSLRAVGIFRDYSAPPRSRLTQRRFAPGEDEKTARDGPLLVSSLSHRLNAGRARDE